MPARFPRLLAAVLSLCACWSARPGYADDARSLLNGYSLTTGVFYEGGSTDYSAFRSKYGVAPTGMGFRYYERNGIITGTVAAIAIALGGAMRAAGPKSVKTWEDSNYRYTETTYYSESEKAAIRDRASRSAGDAMGSPTQSFDLLLYSRNLGGDTTGWKATMMLGSGMDDENSRLDFGFYFGGTNSAVVGDGKSLLTSSTSIGMPFRFNYAFPWLLTWAEFDWNWYGHAEAKQDVVKGTTLAQDVHNMPWRIGAALSIRHRLYIEAVATTPRLTSGQFGFNASTGLRF